VKEPSYSITVHVRLRSSARPGMTLLVHMTTMPASSPLSSGPLFRKVRCSASRSLSCLMKETPVRAWIRRGDVRSVRSTAHVWVLFGSPDRAEASASSLPRSSSASILTRLDCLFPPTHERHGTGRLAWARRQPTTTAPPSTGQEHGLRNQHDHNVLSTRAA